MEHVAYDEVAAEKADAVEDPQVDLDHVRLWHVVIQLFQLTLDGFVLVVVLGECDEAGVGWSTATCCDSITMCARNRNRVDDAAARAPQLGLSVLPRLGGLRPLNLLQQCIVLVHARAQLELEVISHFVPRVDVLLKLTTY